MKLNLTRIFDVVGECSNFEYDIPLEKLADIKGYTFDSPISVKGSVCNRAGIVRLKFTAEFFLHVICDRCLDELRQGYSYSFEHVVVSSLNTDTDEYIVVEENQLDLDELALSDLLLQLPSKLLCREECKGLCTNCGHDLNKSECGCVVE